ncbi:NADPH-dependent FMN reductase [Rugosimonospora acidiphila]|uniref:NADPH-dependent FMN reductase n=1 Tax=Rugosimonospora acidiphila TaxID=556531 RepID=UPI0031E9F88E
MSKSITSRSTGGYNASRRYWLTQPGPRAGRTHTHAHAWARKISSFDAIAFVTPEYNGSVPGALKDAINFLYAEWNDKATGFVGYGIQGGIRAVEHLRQILSDLAVIGRRSTVA